MSRDLDGRPERREGLLQAIDHEPWPFVVLVAWCQPEAEAWYVCAFEPDDDRERDLVAALAYELELHPIHAAERLTSTAPSPLRDAKRVLGVLTAKHPERRSRCLAAPLEHLRSHGPRTGLAAFLEQVETDFIPLWPR